MTTFGRLAEALGDVTAARWVASWLWNDPEAAKLASHRVVLRDGAIGGNRPQAMARQSQRLETEGVPLDGGRVDLERFVWNDFQTDRPLEELKRSQELLASQVSLAPRTGLPQRVGGVDLSYAGDWDAAAAYAVVDVATGGLIWSTTVQCRAAFPYITGYLSFREIPLHEHSLAIAEAAGQLADVLLVDGSGILHKRKAGIASHLGVVTGLCTIGVTKTLLLGTVETCRMTAGECRPVLVGGETCGWAIQPRPTGKPFYVSPGHGCDAGFARDVVLRLLRGRKLPEPIWWADSLSRQAVRG